MSAERKPVLAFQQSSPALTQVVWSEQELARQRVLSQQMCEQLGGVLLEEELHQASLSSRWHSALDGDGVAHHQ